MLVKIWALIWKLDLKLSEIWLQEGKIRKTVHLLQKLPIKKEITVQSFIIGKLVLKKESIGAANTSSVKVTRNKSFEAPLLWKITDHLGTQQPVSY